MKKYKVLVIKLLMRNGKMADFGTLHSKEAFNGEIESLVKEGFVALASKSEVEAAKKLAEETGKEAEEESEEEEGSGKESKK